MSIDYTPAVLDVLNSAIAAALPHISGPTPTLTIATLDRRSPITAAYAALGDGTVLSATTATLDAHWTTDTEPTLRLDRFTEDDWNNKQAPYLTVFAPSPLSPTAVAEALTHAGVTRAEWYHRNNLAELEALNTTYAEELAALHRLGLDASFKNGGSSPHTLTVEQDDDVILYIGTSDDEDPFLSEDRAVPGWSIDRANADGYLVNAQGRTRSLDDREATRTSDTTPTGLAALAISTGYAPDLTRWTLPASDTLTIPDVAAAVIADIWDYVYASPFSRPTVIRMFEAEALSLSQRSTAIVRAFAAQTSRPRQEWTEEYRSLVRSWIKARLIEPDS